MNTYANISKSSWYRRTNSHDYNIYVFIVDEWLNNLWFRRNTHNNNTLMEVLYKCPGQSNMIYFFININWKTIKCNWILLLCLYYYDSIEITMSAVAYHDNKKIVFSEQSRNKSSLVTIWLKTIHFSWTSCAIYNLSSRDMCNFKTKILKINVNFNNIVLTF